MKVTDPVCGMTIEGSEAPERSEYDGETYFFCSSDCREEFAANPDDYVS